MEARDIQTEFVCPIGKDDGKRYNSRTLATLEVTPLFMNEVKGHEYLFILLWRQYNLLDPIL